MKKNEGKIDRILRVIFGGIIIGIGFYFKSWWGLVGLILFLTGLTGYCSIYTLFGINTCSKK